MRKKLNVFSNNDQKQIMRSKRLNQISSIYIVMIINFDFNKIEYKMKE